MSVILSIHSRYLIYDSVEKEFSAMMSFNVTHRFPYFFLPPHFKFDMKKKLKWNWLDCVNCYSRGVECLPISLATVSMKRQDELRKRKKSYDKVSSCFSNIVFTFFYLWREKKGKNEKKKSTRAFLMMIKVKLSDGRVSEKAKLQ